MSELYFFNYHWDKNSMQENGVPLRTDDLEPRAATSEARGGIISLTQKVCEVCLNSQHKLSLSRLKQNKTRLHKTRGLIIIH